LLLRLSIGLAAAAALSGCSEEKSTQARAPAPKVQVRAQILAPQTVTLTSELPGRTSANVVAEVRPRVGGIVRSRNFQEGSSVKAGDILYELDSAPFEATYRNAEAALRRARGVVPTAQARFDRIRLLQERNVVSQQSLDDARTALVQAQADVAATTAALETARINLDYTKVRAPIDGRADASSVTEGALLTASQTAPLVTIRQVDQITVDLVQSSGNLLRLNKAMAAQQIKRNGDEASVELLLEDGSRYSQPGKMQFLASNVSASAGTVTMRAIFANPHNVLMPGMYVRAIVEDGYVENSFLIPQRAVTRNVKGEAVAKFVNAKDVIEERVISVDRNIGNSWLVVGGVAAGDRVVVEGGQKVRGGQEVAVSAVQVDDKTGEIRVDVAAETNGKPGAPSVIAN
jgi:membrane fusion protein (multidrug efflux system)